MLTQCVGGYRALPDIKNVDGMDPGVLTCAARVCESACAVEQAKRPEDPAGN